MAATRAEAAEVLPEMQAGGLADAEEMKRQMLITECTSFEFDRKVNAMLEAGWRIVTNTLKVTVASSWGNSYYSYSVILERP